MRSWNRNRRKLREKPQREKGYWKAIMMSEATGWDCSLTGGRDEVFEHRCSKCGNAARLDEFGYEILSNFCPDCGEDLRYSK